VQFQTKRGIHRIYTDFTPIFKLVADYHKRLSYYGGNPPPPWASQICCAAPSLRYRQYKF